MNETDANSAATRLALSDTELFDLTKDQAPPSARKRTQDREKWLEERRVILGQIMAAFFELPQSEEANANVFTQRRLVSRLAAVNDRSRTSSALNVSLYFHSRTPFNESIGGTCEFVQ